MDEMQLIREMNGNTELATPEELAPARARLLAATAGARAQQPTGPRRRRFGTGARLGFGGVIGIAAAAAAVVVIAPFGGQAPEASAAQVLHGAAEAALALPDAEPEADQFVYKKVALPDGRSYELWRSVDGTRDGQYVEGGESSPVYGCQDGKQQVPKPTGRPTEETDCEASPAVRTGLPTEPDAMLSYLVDHTKAVPKDQQPLAKYLVKDFLVLQDDLYTEPEARAALFEAFATLPDIATVEDAEDATGRSGIGIKVTGDDDARSSHPVLVFDPETYAYLGSSEDTVVGVGITDKVGERP
ncbi:CU044_5270 family protein [Amycolatopsis palatopharyngis]|uniref:CU044_5270 family protein n=1 Tax=Amycolatopsis palatopharyngis TaxID=187982 RepID=UPI000E23407D|nr:CU044_5270 family protein [Amycolatopsis palatopharyngis]